MLKLPYNRICSGYWSLLMNIMEHNILYNFNYGIKSKNIRHYSEEMLVVT